MSAGGRWLLENCSTLRVANVIDRNDLWAGALEYEWLRCPVCSDTYQYAATWEVVPDRDAYEAGWGGRGDLVVLLVWGECEHRWELCFGSHKGETFCFVRVPHAYWTEVAA